MPSAYWVIFDNFRLYFYGKMSADVVTAIREIGSGTNRQTKNEVFDLQGRKVMNPTKGLYIVNGKKVLVK